jgi:hypothetical protein
MRILSLWLLAAGAGVLLLLPTGDGVGQGKFHPGGHTPPPAPTPHPGVVHTPSINPAPVHLPTPPPPPKPPKPPVVQPPPQVKLPSDLFKEEPKITKPVFTPTPVHKQNPGVLAGSGKGPIGPVHKDPVVKWTGLPKDTHFQPVVKKEFSPVIQKKVSTALAKRPPKVGDKDFNLISVNRYKNHGAVIRNKFRPIQHNWFTNEWWQKHHFANAPRWHYYNEFHHHPWNYWWHHSSWPIFIIWFPYPWGPPFYFDYGQNIIFQNNYVYINGEPVATAPEYIEQAYSLANAPPPPPDLEIEWLPLGTFALSAGVDDPSPNFILQLAASKTGLISGTMFNQASGEAIAMEGRVDPVSQRVAIKPVDRDDMVIETGIYNLTQPQTPVMVYFGLYDTQTWFLVRLSAPADGSMPGGPMPGGPG